ncbi:MAG: flippase [Thermoleophilia bacterium]|nr:flippase [Thermoleophilia bacterium]
MTDGHHVADPVDGTGALEARRHLVFRMATNTVVQAAGTVLGSAIAFVTFVVMTRGLGPESFGHFTAASIFLFIPVVLADVGLSAAVLREISAAPNRTEELMRASIGLRFLLSLAAVAVALAIGLLAPFAEQTKTAMLISSVGALFTLLNLSLLPVLQVQLKMHWAVAGNLLGRLVTLGTTIGAVAAGLGFAAIVAATSLGLVVTFLFDLAFVRRLVSVRPRFHPAAWRSLVRASLLLGLSGALGQIYFRIDTVLLALLRPPEEVGIYGAAYKFIEIGELVIAFVSVSILPTLVRFVEEGNPRARRLTQKGFDIVVAVSAPLAVVLFAFADDIVVLASGREFAGAALALRLLVPFLLAVVVNQLLWRVLVAARRDRELLALSASILVVNVALNVALIPEYGYRAAALVSLASEVTLLIFVAIAVRRAVSFLPSPRYAGLVAGGAALMAAVVVVLRDAPPLLAGALALAVYGTMLAAAPGTVRETIVDLAAGLRRHGARA